MASLDELHTPLDRTPATRGRVVVFVAAAFMGSTLLFLVQPLAARLLLPVVGGSAALWNTAMVFFQLVLLAGYVFAHGFHPDGAHRTTPFRASSCAVGTPPCAARGVARWLVAPNWHGTRNLGSWSARCHGRPAVLRLVNG